LLLRLRGCLELRRFLFDFCDVCFFFSSRRRHTRSYGDWSSDVCSSDLSTPFVSTRHGASASAYSRIRTRSLTRNGSPPVNENWRTPSAAPSSMKGTTSANVTRARRRSPGLEPSRQKGQARLHAVPV